MLLRAARDMKSGEEAPKIGRVQRAGTCRVHHFSTQKEGFNGGFNGGLNDVQAS